MLLAIDTSTDVSGVALRDERSVLAECIWFSGRRHGEQVMPMIDHVLRNVDVEPVELQAVTVATGPGSWSGLRVGMSIAKALAVANNIAIIGVPTLDVLAYALRHHATQIVPLVRLGRDRYGAAVYRSAPMWERVAPFQNVSLDELPSLVNQGLFCGDVDDAAHQLLSERYGAAVQFAQGSDNVRRAAVLADLGWQRWQHDDVDDVVTLEPLYLGNPVRT
jgi:tRNA threonylcarbamoyladenosine biosynthesis protein TsaB